MSTKSKIKKNITRIRRNKHQINVASLVKRLVIRGENKHECTEFVSKLVHKLDPQTEIEELFAEKIIFLWWKLRRLFEIERIMLSQQNEPREKYDKWGNEVKGQRVRNIKNIKVHSPQIQEIITQQIAIEKALSKTLGQYDTQRYRQE